MNIKIKVAAIMSAAVVLSFPSFFWGGAVSAGGGEITIVESINIVDRLEPVLEKDEKGNPKIITGAFKAGESFKRKVSVINEGVEQKVAFSFKFIQDGGKWTGFPPGIQIFITPVQGEEDLLKPGELVLLPQQSVTEYEISFELLANVPAGLYQEAQLFLERLVKGKLEKVASLLIAQNLKVAESIVIEGKTQPILSENKVLRFNLIMQNFAQVEQTISVDFLFWLTIVNEDGTVRDTLFYRGRQDLYKFPRQVEVTTLQQPVVIPAATEAAAGRIFIPIEVRFLPGPDLYHFGMKLLVKW